QRPKLKVRLAEPLHKRPDYEFYFRLILDRKEEGYEAIPLGWGRNLPDSLLQMDALLIAPFGISEYQVGEEVEVELICGPEHL
ncbi:MAG TPA: molybdopterin molybdenumtransferase MoeA, partial [Desulfitobacterium dehalogenans]|nr:molybdopterin molybdenumtransferase MoeA [Desulfitobacterium dehalogenans]